jgi:hypothetical protein
MCEGQPLPPPTRTHRSPPQGFLFPGYQNEYWLGAVAAPWPDFIWLVGTEARQQHPAPARLLPATHAMAAPVPVFASLLGSS